MAKKLVLKLKDNRPNLIDDFTSWISKHKTVSYDFYDYDCEDWGCFYGWENNWGYPQEDDDEYDWINQKQDILDWQEAYDSTINDDDTMYNDYWNRKAEESRKKKKHQKRGKRGGKKREIVEDDDVSTPSTTDSEIDAILSETKNIYFYTDIENEKSSIKFTNLRSFFNYLEDNGIDISDNEGGKIIRSKEAHCCINPLKKRILHTKEIISDHSYGALAYEASEDSIILGN